MRDASAMWRKKKKKKKKKKKARPNRLGLGE
jgi:hypothetical protein